jgi:hypothetical protein
MRVAIAAAISVMCAPLSWAEDAVRPGQFVVEPPTLICLGFEWDISGDDNRNATVEVQYRRAGVGEWKEALPLLRMGGERVFRAREFLDYTVPDRFAGSILDLEPGIEYEVRLTMKDPDGVNGQAMQTARVRTRTEPQPFDGGRTLHVYPPDWKGEKQEPLFTGLKEAYYGPGRGDWSAVWERPVQPGDTILVHGGLYKGDRLDYVNPLSVPFDGTYTLTAKGTAERPVTIRAAGDGEPIFDGNGAHVLFDVMAASHHIFDGLSFRNADVVFLAGRKRAFGAVGLTVRNCRFEDVGIGITTEFAGSKAFYIADNVFLGREDRYRVLGWASPSIYGAAPLKSYFAVKVYGSGHVIAHNSIAYFHDGICISTYGTPETEQHLKAVAIDIYNNDIHVVADDFIESDGGVHNIRVMRNRGANSGQCALSAQPVFGGPVYFIRNLVYHIPNGVALKFMAKPAGILFYHNTIISENRNRDPYSNAHFRNNLFLGVDAPNRGITTYPNATAYSTYDYNGYRPSRGVDAQYTWAAPAAGELRNYELSRNDFRSFRTLAELASATGQERHGIEVDYDIFERMQPPDPSRPHAVYHAADLDFRLKAGSKAVDAGMRLPNVNDRHGGRAPDLGALELGQPVPVYGPRGRTAEAFYR